MPDALSGMAGRRAQPRRREELERAGIPSLLAAVLSARGIRTWEEARALLAPGETPLEDPMGLRDMDPGGPPRPPGPGDGGDSGSLWGLRRGRDHLHLPAHRLP